MNESPRYCPSMPFPAYSYVTGRWPHPLNDPAGHSSHQATASVPRLSSPQDANRYAVDLWNAGYYWEAHEAWEHVWNDAGRHGTVADLYKGLIKLAAAGVKAREARPNGVTRHLTRARELFGQVLAVQSRRPLSEHRPDRLIALADKLLAVQPIEVPHEAAVGRVWRESIELALKSRRE